MNRSTFAGGLAAFAALPVSAGAQELERAVIAAASESTGTVGVYARRMTPGPAAVWYRADERFPSASVIKLLIFVTLFQEIDAHPALWQKKLTLHIDDFVGGSDFLQNANPGDRYTIASLARAMIVQSDNTASNVLISYFGFERINQTAHRAGLVHTQLHRHFMDYAAIVHHSENLTSAHDMGSLLYQIERGMREALPTVASASSCRRMIDILLQQEDRDKIARGLPRGEPLANKTGEIDGVRNDVGIVDPYGDAPYVLAVLTKDLADFSEGNLAIRRIAKAVNAVLSRPT